jgi:putative DNA primase/helicase
VNYDPAATCQAFERFLSTALPQSELVEYLQRAIGYALTADVREKSIFILSGGPCGKTALLLLLTDLLGGYACRSGIFSPFRGRPLSPTPDLVELRDARLAVCFDGARRLDERTVKLLTGPTITARAKYKSAETFNATHKLFIEYNAEPVLRGSTDALWRRVKVFRFASGISPEISNPGMLCQFRAELPGILAWAVRGSREWMVSGLGSAPMLEVS